MTPIVAHGPTEALRRATRRVLTDIRGREIARGGKLTLAEIAAERILPRGCWSLIGGHPIEASWISWRRRGRGRRRWSDAHLTHDRVSTACGLPVPSRSDHEIVFDREGREPCRACEAAERARAEDERLPTLEEAFQQMADRFGLEEMLNKLVVRYREDQLALQRADVVEQISAWLLWDVPLEDTLRLPWLDAGEDVCRAIDFHVLFLVLTRNALRYPALPASTTPEVD